MPFLDEKNKNKTIFSRTFVHFHCDIWKTEFTHHSPIYLTSNMLYCSSWFAILCKGCSLWKLNGLKKENTQKQKQLKKKSALMWNLNVRCVSKHCINKGYAWCCVVKHVMLASPFFSLSSARMTPAFVVHAEILHLSVISIQFYSSLYLF